MPHSQAAAIHFLLDDRHGNSILLVSLSVPFHKYGLVFCTRLYRSLTVAAQYSAVFQSRDR
jgi:hypothetical protein